MSSVIGGSNGASPDNRLGMTNVVGGLSNLIVGVSNYAANTANVLSSNSIHGGITNKIM